MGDLFESLRRPERLAEGAIFLPSAVLDEAEAIMAMIGQVSARSPFRYLTTPGGGQMSVAMTGCGSLGWHADHTGYRYTPTDPLTDAPWPEMPAWLSGLAGRVAAEAGYEGFEPQVCLINQYRPGSRMGLHQDRDEACLSAPIVSISLGLPARFLFGGPMRSSPRQVFALHHGDAVVWGGPSRLFYHGVSTIKAGVAPLTDNFRYNLTFRKVR